MQKHEKASGKSFVVYNPHTTSLEQQVWSLPLRVVSIDPGRKNFAMRIERRFQDRVVTEVFIRKTFEGSTKGDRDTLYSEITQFLDQHLELLQNSHYVLMERQLPSNYQSVRISQHVLTYMLMKLQDASHLPIIVEVHPNLKAKALNAPKNINSNGLKKWAVEKATEICKNREDDFSLSAIRNERGARGQRKGDDLADTILQIEAVMSLGTNA